MLGNPIEAGLPEKAPAPHHVSIGNGRPTANVFPNNDVVIVGAGPGGLAVAISLARAGQRVVCIDPDPFPRLRVGESLDWSTPALLRALGLPTESLIKRGVGTYKRKIKVEPIGEAVFGAQPDEYKFLIHKPFEFEVLTLHVDRSEMDVRLFRMAADLGVAFVWDRVTHLETKGDQVLACCTEQNGRFVGRWFIDASGRAQLFAKAFRIPKTEYGRLKVCLWSYFKSPCVYEGTTFFTNGRAEYLSWIWKIPITPDTVSIGYVGSADDFRENRLPEQSKQDFLLQEMARFPGLQRLAVDHTNFRVSSCSWRSYVQKRVSGFNWLAVGESAALPDPLTSNGVTAAFRHAHQAARLLLGAGTSQTFLNRERRAYETNVRRMGHIFNYSIERVIYDPPVRRGISTDAALRVYAHFGYLINALFAKFEPCKPLGLFLFGLLLVGVRFWMETWVLISRVGTLLSRSRQSGHPLMSAPRGASHA
jgi:flavin-dependent dehydrogenase